MRLSTALTRDTIVLGLTGATKDAIIEELVDVLCATGKVADRVRALESVFERERSMSTGMKNGIALPHGKTDAVTGLVACVGVSKQPVPFDCLDGEPARVFVMTLSPPDRNGPHLRFLAEISILFKSDERRAALLTAKTPDDVLALFAD